MHVTCRVPVSYKVSVGSEWRILTENRKIKILARCALFILFLATRVRHFEPDC